VSTTPNTIDAPRSLFAPAAPPPTLLTRDQCEAIAKKVLSFAKADETRVVVSSSANGNMRFAVNQASTSGDNYDNTVTVRSAFGKRSASSTTNSYDDASLKAVVERAESLAKLAPEDPEAMPEIGPQTYPSPPAWSDATASLEAATRAAAVNAITSTAKAANLVSTGFLDTNAGSFAVANNKGLFAYHRQTLAALSTTIRTPEGTGSGWAGAANGDFSKIDASALGKRAADKARRSVNPVAIEPGRYTVVLEPTAVGNIIGLIQSAFDARSADEGRSFFSKPGGGTKLGMKVFDERVTLTSDPMDPDTPGTPFAPDGTPVGRRVWVENGVLKTLSYSRYWAQQKNMQPNAGGGGALKMAGGNATLEEMIASTQRGILWTRFWYIRGVDQRTVLFTGLTRDGTFLIENGKITRPVKNLRWNESPVFVLNNLEMLGRPERVISNEANAAGPAMMMPPIKARDFNFTSASDAI
jgi:predicted Zn-dependent protease